MSAFHIWRDDPPPKDTMIWVKYELLEDWQSVRTCKRGCCVISDGFTMILPKYWKEIEQEQPHD